MSFQVYEESTDQGLEVELYRFSNAGGAHEWLYTDSEIPVVRPEGTYLIGPIDRGEISSSGNLDKSKLDVTVAGNHPVAILFAVNPPTFGIDLVIRSGHFDDPDAEFVQIWDGRVLSCEWSDDAKVAVLTCEPLTASMRRIGLRRMYQKSCPHALYGDRCRAVKSLHTFECTVVSITGRVLGVVPPPEQSAAAIQEVVETVVAEVDMVFRGGGFFSGALITALFLAATQVAVSLPAAAMGDLKTFVSGQVDWTAPDGFRWVRTVEDS